MIGKVKKLILPVYDVSLEDRTAMIALESVNSDLQKRMRLLEEAVYRQKQYGNKGKTIFDDYD